MYIYLNISCLNQHIKHLIIFLAVPGNNKVYGVTNNTISIKYQSHIQNLGHIVVDCTPSSATSTLNSLSQHVQAANSNEVGVFASIHFNIFNGSAHGTEV
ncbi:MAG: hypothetical protein ACREVX_04455 [Clostridium sp.]|uniref:hypothetical protein n=1 Tax=Clostridium sp. TaxID=1506 RepID=UPI003D6D7C7C